MSILIVYGTTEGHTQHLCEYLQQVFGGAAQEVVVAAAGEQAPDPKCFDLILLCGSLHVGDYQSPLTEFARRHCQTLNEKPTAFIPSRYLPQAGTPTTGAGAPAPAVRPNARISSAIGWARALRFENRTSLRNIPYEY